MSEENIENIRIEDIKVGDNIKPKKLLQCDACGKNIEHEDGSKSIAMQVSLSALSHDIVKQSIGPYYTGDKLEYNICWECLFKSLGIPAPALQPDLATVEQSLKDNEISE